MISFIACSHDEVDGTPCRQNTMSLAGKWLRHAPSLPVRFLPLPPVYPFLDISTRFLCDFGTKNCCVFYREIITCKCKIVTFEYISSKRQVLFNYVFMSFHSPKSAHYDPWSEQPNHCFYHCGCLECFCDDATTVFSAPLSTCFTYSPTCLCLPNLACLNWLSIVAMLTPVFIWSS